MADDKRTNRKQLSVVMVASEITPFAKTGGLGDVMGSLPKALSRSGARVTMIMPAYRAVIKGNFAIEDTGISIGVPVAGRTENSRILKSSLTEGVPVYLVWSDKYFDRDYLYNTPDGDYPDNAERFAFFSRAILEIMKIDPPQILHANDWQTALSIAFLKSQPERYPELQSVKTVMTVHNLGYQGRFWNIEWPLLELDWRWFTSRYLEFYNDINYLKGGIVFADAITTVSPTYAEEIKTAEQGFGLEGVFQERAGKLFGILNGVDYDIWDPAIDGLIPGNYSLKDTSGKVLCKNRLQEYFGLIQDANTPLLGMVTRLSRQKGLDLVYDICGSLLSNGCQIAVLGSGDRDLQDRFKAIAATYPERVGVEIDFKESLAHQIIAGSDMLLMPSRYEPGGLTQLYALKYGNIPVVRATGGLKDTVTSFKPRSRKGNGFTFDSYDAKSLLQAVNQGFTVFQRKDQWSVLMKNAMSADFSWDHSAVEYLKLYRNLIYAQK